VAGGTDLGIDLQAALQLVLVEPAVKSSSIVAGCGSGFSITPRSGRITRK
jgi:hypothetical protein